MKLYEYKYELIKTDSADDLVAWLNVEGQKGWKVDFTSSLNKANILVYFSREIGSITNAGL